MLQNGAEHKKAHAPNHGKRRWTVIDTTLVVLALAVLVGIVYRAVDFLRQDSPTQYHVHVVGTQPVYHTIPQQIGQKDDVYLYDSGVRLGYMQAEHVVCGEPDTYGNVTFSGYITVESGTYKDGKLTVGDGDATLAPGDTVVICTDRVALSVRVEAIEEQVEDRGWMDTSADETTGTTESETGDEVEVVTEPETETEPEADAPASSPDPVEESSTTEVARETDGQDEGSDTTETGN